jgi:hypothetical protein
VSEVVGGNREIRNQRTMMSNRLICAKNCIFIMIILGFWVHDELPMLIDIIPNDI